jgi:hypothetical protein
MALGSTQPLVKMSTRNMSGGKAVGAWGWQTHHLHVPNVMKSGSLNLLEPSRPHRACYGTPFLRMLDQARKYSYRSGQTGTIGQSEVTMQYVTKWNMLCSSHMCRCVDERIKIVVCRKRHLNYTSYRRNLEGSCINKLDGSEKGVEG